jgi:hypothetical protein
MAVVDSAERDVVVLVGVPLFGAEDGLGELLAPFSLTVGKHTASLTECQDLTAAVGD